MSGLARPGTAVSLKVLLRSRLYSVGLNNTTIGGLPALEPFITSMTAFSSLLIACLSDHAAHARCASFARYDQSARGLAGSSWRDRTARRPDAARGRRVQTAGPGATPQ